MHSTYLSKGSNHGNIKNSYNAMRNGKKYIIEIEARCLNKYVIIVLPKILINIRKSEYLIRNYENIN